MDVKIYVFHMPFTFFLFILGDLVSYFFLLQNNYFSDNAPLINVSIKNFIKNILQFLILNLIFSLQKYCLDFTADFTKIHVKKCIFMTFLIDIIF